MAEPSGRRERKKQERRRRIEDVAVALFERQGFEATTIEQIAEEADIAPRTFFSYFASKDDLVLADYAERLDRILSELEQRPPDEPAWDALGRAFSAVASDYTTEIDRLARRFAIMAETPSVHARSLALQAGWEQALADRLAVRLGTAPTDPTPRLMAATALAIMRASLGHWLTNGLEPPLPDLVEQAFGRIGRGLSDR